jgi:hypothetical protein
MKNLIRFILYVPLIYSNDYLLQAMYADYKEPETTETTEVSDNSEAEHYSWELGTRDDMPDLEVIYEESNPCELTYR